MFDIEKNNKPPANTSPSYLSSLQNINLLKNVTLVCFRASFSLCNLFT